MKLQDIPYVKNPKVIGIIDDAFHSNKGGIQVLFAPAGTGKTTYLALVSQEHKVKGEHVEFVSCAASKQHLYACLNILNEAFQLSEVLPEKTVLVLDQMETPILGPELKSMLLEIALDSRKSKRFNVILSVSNIEAAKKILSLNGNDKIKSLGRCAEYRWGRELVTAYVEQSKQYTAWTDADRASLVELAIVAGAPEFLFQLEDEKAPTAALLREERIVESAKRYATAWENAAKAGL